MLGKLTSNTEVAISFHEALSNGKNLIGKQGEVKRFGDDRSTLENVQHRTVACLDGQDCGSSSQDARVLDKVRSTQISANANMLYDPCGRDHGRYISESRRKVERATRRRCDAEPGHNGL